LNVKGGGFLVAGERYPVTGPAELAYIFQVDPNGVIQRSRIFDGGGNMAEALAAKNTLDGGYIIAGRAERTIVANNIFMNMSSEMRYLYLLKIHGQGNPVWSKKYNTGQQVRMTRANEVYACKDGGYIVAGEFKYNDSRKDLDMGLLKVSKNGDVIWAKQFGGTEMDAGTEVLETLDGGYIIAGETESFGSGKLDICLIKTDKSGNKLWAKTYGGAGHDQIGAITELGDGRIAVVGKTTRGNSKNVQALLLMLDKNGNQLSSQGFGGSGIDIGVSVIPSGTGLIIGANSMSFGAGGMDLLVIKHDLANAGACNSSSTDITAKTFAPKITDMTSRVVTEVVNESTSIKVIGSGTTEVENIKLNGKNVCK
ncbi:MAG: hypothetical protein JKX73_06610, partial [Flavobacteriales bacterium]|nr:hypothetical protein [Flavobacteriales bacterium]